MSRREMDIRAEVAAAVKRWPGVHPAFAFLRVRVFAADLDQAEEAFNRAVIDLCRAGIAPPAMVLPRIAEDLEVHHGFKSRRDCQKLRDKQRRQLRAEAMRERIKFIAAAQNISKEKAAEIFANERGMKVEALRKQMLPSRIAGKNSI